MKYLILCILFLLGSNAVAAESFITINVNNSSDAMVIMEKDIPLSKSELVEWENALKSSQNISKYKTPEYDDLFKIFQNYSLNFSNRSMEVQTYNVTYETKKTLSDGIGIIKYDFVWKNFSYYESDNIVIGDAFPGGVFLLSPNNQLRIIIPEGYEVAKAVPEFEKKNGNILVWDGTSSGNFSAGEPLVILSPSNQTNLSPLQEFNKYPSWSLLIIEGILIFFIIIVSLAFYRFWKHKRLEKVSTTNKDFYKDMITEMPDEMINEISEIPEFWKKMVQSVQKEHGDKSIEDMEKAAREQRLVNMGLDPAIPLSDPSFEDIDDEEMIHQFLLRKGGQSYQSDIVEYSGLSKSKISMVLSKMKGDGKIIKIRKGKENLIRLVKPPENEG
ncbi:MAG: hypothetical protein OIN87_01320 [Candidatus Methanoperedens sp.]|nr:hypothetical protein [Candidatus Methanoperedens sp.]